MYVYRNLIYARKIYMRAPKIYFFFSLDLRCFSSRYPYVAQLIVFRTFWLESCRQGNESCHFWQQEHVFISSRHSRHVILISLAVAAQMDRHQRIKM